MYNFNILMCTCTWWSHGFLLTRVSLHVKITSGVLNFQTMMQKHSRVFLLKNDLAFQLEFATKWNIYVYIYILNAFSTRLKKISMCIWHFFFLITDLHMYVSKLFEQGDLYTKQPEKTKCKFPEDCLHWI